VTIVLDNEAVQALLDVAHPKHRRTLAFLDVSNGRNRRRQSTSVVVPVAVRVEAGWDRTSAAGVVANHLSRARDSELHTRAADRAVQLREASGVSVVDATLGQTLGEVASPVVVLTSDVEDMQRLADLVDGAVRVVRI
jgi:hypothetical protein